MERRINQKVELTFQKFKEDIKNKLVNSKYGMTDQNLSELITYVYNYPVLQFTKQDFTKRKRVKNVVPLSDRCNALRANGEQCTRRRKDDHIYCGTHIKGIPHGEITDNTNNVTHKTRKVWAQEIKGIIYYIDNDNNVYKPQEILENKINPSIIAKYTFDPITNTYDIPDLFQKN